MSKNLPVTLHTTEFGASTAKLATGDDDDQVAFWQVYDRYAPVLFGIITQMVKNQAEAIGLLESTFIRVRQQVDQFPAQNRPLFVWLLSIARSTVLDFLRKQKRSDAPMLQLGKAGTVISVVLNHSPENPIAQSRIDSDTQQNDLIDSVLFTRCTPDEAAASSGIPVEMARQQLRAAVQQLRTLPTS